MNVRDQPEDTCQRMVANRSQFTERCRCGFGLMQGCCVVAFREQRPSMCFGRESPAIAILQRPKDAHALRPVGARFGEPLLVQRDFAECPKCVCCVVYVAHPSMLNQCSVKQATRAGEVEPQECGFSRHLHSERNAKHAPSRLPKRGAFKGETLRCRKFAPTQCELTQSDNRLCLARRVANRLR